MRSYHQRVRDWMTPLFAEGLSNEQIAQRNGWPTWCIGLARDAFFAPEIPGERWLPVVGYEELYEVSDHGRVRSLKPLDAGRMLYQSHRKGGYRSVALSGGGCRPRGFLVHRLVLEAFVGPCPEGMEACHRDDKPSNNRLENLRWDTHAENMRDRVRNRRARKAA